MSDSVLPGDQSARFPRLLLLIQGSQVGVPARRVLPEPVLAVYRELADYGPASRSSAAVISPMPRIFPVKSWAEMDPDENETVETMRRSFNCCGRPLQANADFTTSEEMLQAPTSPAARRCRPDPTIAERYRILVMPAVPPSPAPPPRPSSVSWTPAGASSPGLPSKSVECGDDPRCRRSWRASSVRSMPPRRPWRTPRRWSRASWPRWRGGALIGYPNEAEDADAGHFAHSLPRDRPDAPARCRGAVVPEVVHYHYERAGRHFVFLTNTSREEPRDTLRLTGGVELRDPRDGSMEPASIVRGVPAHAPSCAPGSTAPFLTRGTRRSSACDAGHRRRPAHPLGGRAQIVGLASAAGKNW